MDFLGDLIGGAVGDAVADKVGKRLRRVLSSGRGRPKGKSARRCDMWRPKR